MSIAISESLSRSTDAFYFEKDKRSKVLVMGVGNYLMGDEGVGVHIVQKMTTMDLPENVEVLDGGTGGFLLLSYFEAYKKIILVDATLDGKAAGSVTITRPRFASDFPPGLSVHDVGLKDMIEAVYLLGDVPEMHLLTVSIEEVRPMHVGLSEKVEKAVPEAIDSLLELCETLQV